LAGLDGPTIEALLTVDGAGLDGTVALSDIPFWTAVVWAVIWA